MKRKRAKKFKAPPQITIGGKFGLEVWNRRILPLIKGEMSTREIAAILGISHNTVSIWRRAYT